MTTNGAIVVIGANGLIGRALRTRLARAGRRVIAVVRPVEVLPVVVAGSEKIIPIDIAAKFNLEHEISEPVDTIIHLAQARGHGAFPIGAGEVAAVAVSATARLAESAVNLGARRFILASSGGVCGSSPVPITEEMRIQPVNELGFYLRAKAFSETIAGSFRPYLEVVTLRYFFVYGPRQRDEMLMSRLFSRIKNGEPIGLAAKTGPVMNPIYVDDAAEATLRAIDIPPVATLNVAGTETVSLRDLTGLIGEIVGMEPVYAHSEGVPPRFEADISAMLTHLGRPDVGLASGLRRTWELNCLE